MSIGRCSSWYMLKLGVSKFDSPWPRTESINASRDNPWAARVEVCPFFCLRVSSMRDAFAVETSLKSLTRHFPWCPRDERPTRLALPASREDETPSGEWMVHPGGFDAAVNDMLGTALVALRPSEDAVFSSGLLGAAYERFFRAALDTTSDPKLHLMSARRARGSQEAWL
jgi:hypothetical protein